MNFLKKRYNKIREDAKKFASSKNVPEQAYSFWMVMQLVLITSSVLSILTLTVIGRMEIPDGILVQVGINMVIPMWIMILFFGLGKYFFYAKILEIHYLNKMLSKGINKLDMYWWRKYRKQSPVTEALNKMQTKAKRKLTKPQKALIFASLMGFLVWFYLYDDVVNIYDSIQEMLVEQKIAENDLGKINDGLK